MAHNHGIVDIDKHFVIDPATRKIINQSDKVVLIQNDHNSERFTFEIPKEVDGHDMTLCNVVRVHYINIDTTTKARNAGFYTVDDIKISPDDENVVIGSWLLSSATTQYVGTLSFAVRFMCVAEDGTIEYSWGTATHSQLKVVETVDSVDDEIEGKYVDFIAQLTARIDALEKIGTAEGGYY